MEYRCAERLHFIRHGDVLEVKCKSKRCGAGRGNVVLHVFDLSSGELLTTQRFRDPTALLETLNGKKEKEASR